MLRVRELTDYCLVRFGHTVMQDHSLEQLAPEVDHRVPLAEQHMPAWQSRLPALFLFSTLIAAISTWFISIRTPLWLDETVSYWQISGGFREIWSRQGLSFPAYSYFLWMQNAVFGSSPYSLRAPSIVAMVAAIYVAYRIAIAFFEKEIALAVAILFAVHPIVIFEAIDARPYAFGVLVVNCAILNLLRWTRTAQTRYAIYTGIFAGTIFYFHFLFGTILVAFAILLVTTKHRHWNSLARQLALAVTSFLVVMIPVFSRLFYLVQTRESHVFSVGPTPDDLVATLAPGALLWVFPLALLAAVALNKVGSQTQHWRPIAGWCICLAFVPTLILYVTSVATPLHVFVERYRLVAVPGVALCWGLLLTQVRSNKVRALFCLTVVFFAADNQFANRSHSYSWKAAVEAANSATADDRAPLLICSDLPESNSLPLPQDVSQSGLFAPLSYYKVHSAIVPLPRGFNAMAEEQVTKFLATNHRRFLAMGFGPSWPTLQWIADRTKASYRSKALGTYDGVAIVEFSPQ